MKENIYGIKKNFIDYESFHVSLNLNNSLYLYKFDSNNIFMRRFINNNIYGISLW